VKPSIVLRAKELARHAKTIATHCGLGVLERHHNPTLVAHGLAKAARWHVITHEAPKRAVADLYVGGKDEALKIGGKLADLLGVQLEVLDNAAMPASLMAHPIKRVTPRSNPLPRAIDRRSIRTVGRGKKRILVGCPTGQYRPRARTRKCAAGMRRVNPPASSISAMTRIPRAGEVWHGLSGDRFRVLSVSSTKVTALQLDSGHRVTSTLSEFLGTYRPPRGSNPSRSSKAKHARAYHRGHSNRKSRRAGRRVLKARASLGGPKASRVSQATHFPRARYYSSEHTRRLAARGFHGPKANPKGRKNPIRYVRTLSPLAERKALAFEAEQRTQVGAGLKKPEVVKRARVLLDAYLRGALQGGHTVSLEEVKSVWLTALIRAAGELRKKPNPSRTKTARARRKAATSERRFYGRRTAKARKRGDSARARFHRLEVERRTLASSNPGGPRIVYNKLLGGWYVVTGPHQRRSLAKAGFKKSAQTRHLIAGQIRRGTKRGLSHGPATNPKGRKSTLPFSVGDVVSISAAQYFGRHGTVVAVGTKLVTVEVHLIGKRVKFAPSFLRLANPKGHDPALDEAVQRIRTGLKKRGGVVWSVTRGTGSTYGWIYIRSPRGDMTPDEQRYLAKLLGIPTVHHQGVMIPSGSRERDDYVARAEGRTRNPKRPNRSPAAHKNARRRAGSATRKANPRDLINQAKSTFSKWQDRDVEPRVNRMRAPPPLPGVATELGKLVSLTYRTDKYDGVEKDHEHDFSPPLASVVTDPQGRDLHIVRGRSRYAITADGIKH